MKNNIETRQITTELRMSPEGKLVGYAAKFAPVLSHDLGGFREEIQQGAFARSIADGDVRAFWNHDVNRLPLGRTKSGTLHLEEDEIGLRFSLDLPDTQDARDLRQSVARGDVDGMSFGFRTIQDEWADHGQIHTLIEADLVEISPVNFPAFPATEVALRSREEFIKGEDAKEEEERLSTEEQNQKIRKMRAERILKIVEASA
jgi:hypothetical protein